MSESTVRIVRIFPEVLSTYGDNGNADILATRCEKRGIRSEITDVFLSDEIPTNSDIYLIGGGEDGAQVVACEKLKESKNFASIIDEDHVLLAVCAGYQILGESFATEDGGKHSALNVIPVESLHEPKRTIGEVVVDATQHGLSFVVGFVNHGGQTSRTDEAQPLGSIRFGSGDSYECAYDGIVKGNLFGTYLHGPVLARNPHFADRLLSLVVGALDPIEPDILKSVWRERLAVCGVELSERE